MSTLRYEPDEKCPPLLLIGTAIQAVTLVLAMTILIVAITVRASGQEDGLLVWASFATLVVVGITMALQASKIGRFGGGHLIVCGVTPNYIAISIIALAEGGPIDARQPYRYFGRVLLRRRDLVAAAPPDHNPYRRRNRAHAHRGAHNSVCAETHPRHT